MLSVNHYFYFFILTDEFYIIINSARARDFALLTTISNFKI